jgi:steroid delta-isomerase-like uncharacterized protein
LIPIILLYSSYWHTKEAGKNEAMVKAFLEALSEHNIDLFPSFFADECLCEEVYSGRKYATKADIAGYIKSSLSDIPDWYFTIESIIADEDMPIVGWIWRGTNSVDWEFMVIPATNKYFELRGIAVMTIDKHLITKIVITATGILL